jgi:exodeoxyribonuclease VII large subunit
MNERVERGFLTGFSTMLDQKARPAIIEDRSCLHGEHFVDFIPRSIYTVTALTAEINDILETSFSEVWVEGEVSNLRIPPSGHFYFTLKDESSQIHAVIFRSQARFLPFQPEDGLSVVCHGRISIYAQRGQYQLILDLMEPRGVGALQLAFDQLKRRLEAEGLFDPSRKKPLPILPKRIGIVTSPTGAVIQDMLTILERRYENVGALVYPVRVQGEGASTEIANGVKYLDQETDVDVIVVARGGGSLEDLWAFNEETVGRAVANAQTPIVSAVGHEVDFTICDFVADVRAPTPSAAAELVVRNKAELLIQIKSLQDRLLRRIDTILEKGRESWIATNIRLKDPRKRLVDLRLKGEDLAVRLTTSIGRILHERRTRLRTSERNLLYRVPRPRVNRLRELLCQEKEKLDTSIQALVRAKRQRLERAMDRLESMSPLTILRRGYGIVRTIPSLRIVRDAKTVKRGERLNVKLHRGELICRVEKTKISS